MAVFLVVVVVFFVLQNSTVPPVGMKLLVWSFETSLAYTIFGSIGMGILMALIFWIPRSVKASIRLRELRKRIVNLERVLYRRASTGEAQTRRVTKKAIIIPVYLKFNQPEELPYLEELNLAKRAIQSLTLLKDQDFTLILPVCFDSIGGDEGTLSLEADRLLRKEVHDLRKGKTVVFCSHHLKILQGSLDQRGFRKFSSLTDLKGFSKIRNIGLLLAQALSMDVSIFIDSDEVVEDPNYLGIACEYLRQNWNGKLVSGKGGFYINPDGSILLSPERLWWRVLWNKTKWMNQTWKEMLSSKGRLIASPMLLGGNLVLHGDLFRNIPFDPYIPRGEDTDYLINASEFGFTILFDKELRLRHLHPERTDVFYQNELRGDIERFLYERGKTKEGLTINLDPYPGYFLNWTLRLKAIVTSLFLSLDYLVRRKWKEVIKSIDNIRLIFQKKGGEWLRYFEFKADWEKVMEEVQRKWMVEILKSCWL